MTDPSLAVRIIFDETTLKARECKGMGMFLFLVALLGGHCYGWQCPEQKSARTFSPNQHAKVVITDAGAICGSKNLSRNSLMFHDVGYVSSNSRVLARYRRDFERQRAICKLFDVSELEPYAYSILKGEEPRKCDLRDRALYLRERVAGIRSSPDYWDVLNPW